MADNNPYQPPNAPLEDNAGQESSSKAGLLNANAKDNLVQAGIIGLTTFLGCFVGFLLYGFRGGLASGFLGMVLGLIVSGTYLMLFGKK